MTLIQLISHILFIFFCTINCEFLKFSNHAFRVTVFYRDETNVECGRTNVAPLRIAPIDTTTTGNLV